VPIVNKVAAGLPREFDDMGYPARVADEYLAVGPGGDPDGFACRVVGASMEPLYREGDIVVFWPSRVVRHGSDCFVRLERDAQTTFKRVFFEPEPEAGCDDAEALAVWGERVERVRLVPLNERFEVRVVTREEVAAIFSAVSVTRALG
jgi:SOS-response transcriptional repressor LexA